MFRIIVDSDLCNPQRLRGLEVYRTNNVMQADCAYTRTVRKSLDESDPIHYGKHIALLHNDKVRRQS